MSSTERERTKREGKMENACLFVPVHVAQLTSNTSISHGVHLSCETKVTLCVEKKEKAHRTEERGVLGLLQVCFYVGGKAGVSEVLWLPHIRLVVGK